MPLGQLGLIRPSGLPTDPPSLGWGRLGPCRGAVLALGGPARSGQALAVVSGLRGATCGAPWLAGTSPPPPRPTVPQPAPGPTWGPEVLRPCTFLVDLRDFCRRGGRWVCRGGRREERLGRERTARP